MNLGQIHTIYGSIKDTGHGRNRKSGRCAVAQKAVAHGEQAIVAGCLGAPWIVAGLLANIANTEALTAVFGVGGEEGADVTCRGPSLCGAARVRLVQELATARRFVAELESVPAISG